MTGVSDMGTLVSGNLLKVIVVKYTQQLLLYFIYKDVVL